MLKNVLEIINKYGVVIGQFLLFTGWGLYFAEFIYWTLFCFLSSLVIFSFLLKKPKK